MLALLLVLFSKPALCQSAQELNAILQFKAQSGSIVANGFNNLEMTVQESPNCQAIPEQVKSFLFDRFPVPASCVRAKKLEQKYMEVLELLEGDCELQIHDLQLVIGNPTECKTLDENRINSNELLEQFDGFIQEQRKSSFICPEDSVDCINECDVYATLILQSMVKTNSISRNIHATFESSLDFACKADRNSNCVDALAAVSKKMPAYISSDSVDFNSCFPDAPSRKPASLEEDRSSLFARIHAKIVRAAAAGNL